MNWKHIFCVSVGIVGGAITQLFGGWTSALTILVICMAIDYVTGLVVAGVFHASKKSPNGGLESLAGWKGLIRKVATLLVVVIAHFFDVLLGSNYVRDVIVIAFVANETISILENIGLMGVPIPKLLTKCIDVLRDKAKVEEEKNDCN